MFSDRIIPTRVGTRIISQIGVFVNTDHPHACGDKLPALWLVYIVLGSSPRVWGQALMVKFIEYYVRIIPTRVGTRNQSPTKSEER